jgi:transglutaminase-like putative cysteine protease
VLWVRQLNPGKHSVLAAVIAAPLCLAAVGCAYLIPTDRPYTENAAQKLLEKPMDAVYDFIYLLFNPKYFSFQSTGFNGAAGQMGGPVMLNNRAVMAVKASGRVYLSGLTKNEYDGSRWTDPIQKNDLFTYGFAPNRFEMLETMEALNRLETDYMPLEKLFVSVSNRTGTVFRPLKSRDIVFFNHIDDLTISPSGDMRTEKLIERYNGYEFEFLPVDTQMDFIQHLLNEAGKGVYDETPYKEYAESVYRHYTSLPDTLPDRVIERAFEITEGAETDYEKITAIEDYLLQFPYTLNPPRISPDTDFVDHFLFEAREGYCTYYASAMAILSRAVGIPARYIEGYLTPPFTYNDWYIITNAHAHAWAEVYLEGYGWYIAEATPPFRHATGYRPAVGPGGTAMFAESFMGYRSYEEYLLSIGIDINAATAGYYWPESVLEAMENNSNTRLSGPYDWIILVSLLVFLFVLYFLFQHTGERFRMWRIGRMAINIQAQIYFKAVIKMTHYYHYPKRENETPMAYAQRLGKRFAFKSDTKFLRDLAVLYYKARYGFHSLTEKELDILRTAHDDMFRLLRAVRWAPRFLFIRYVRKITRV